MAAKSLFYPRIRELREEHDLKQQTLAKKLSCSQSTYSRYEKGKVGVPSDVLIELSDLYECSVDYILGLSDIYERNVGKRRKIDTAGQEMK